MNSYHYKNNMFKITHTHTHTSCGNDFTKNLATINFFTEAPDTAVPQFLLPKRKMEKKIFPSNINIGHYLSCF